MKSNKVILDKLGACGDAVKWASGYETLQAAWDHCHRGDWMLWLCGKLSGKVGSKSRKLVVKAACACARLSLKYVAKGEDRPRICIETAEKYCEGKATLEQVRVARKNAAAAAYAAYAAAAAAAVAVAAAAYAYAAYAYAAYAYADAADAAARNKTLKECADIVRKYYPNPPITND